MNRAAQLISTMFGVGLARYAPGTMASLVALPLAWLIAWEWGRFVLLLASILALAVGGWASELYAARTQTVDPKECVIDELAGQWIACAFAPVSIPAYILAFILFRVFDITKPWPVNRAERLHGGVGIMADDLVAALMAGAIIAALAHLNLI